ncbi:MarR family winged helix-turn-helix transcriptional regulator [uncultured Shimia sp.]|uniref:MarR family winged helix-turn-helix transcriptional regulator n=1 Tax=uncultured Shimia sp. TaxID=573152 RepID=UPI0026375CC9|nr:MarR family winged helix-turn-helix transcriptional regulator [uncultured Shimia sp.]
MSELDDALFLIDPNDSESSPARRTLSFRRTPTVLLNFAANRFTRNAARYYQKQFGIGAMDWRMLVMLSREPGSSVSHAAKTIGIDKAAVSRSLQRLEKMNLVSAKASGPDERRKDWTLTPAGARMHDEILIVALERQRQLLTGFSKAEVEQFTDYLARFLSNLDTLADDTTDD